MGTRGCYGFRKNDVDKLTYNHWDSYPDWLGKIMVKFCKETTIQEMNEIFDKLILVKENDKPTKAQIAECIEYYNGDVGSQTPEDWYCLLREAQGNPDVYKCGLKYMTDGNNFIRDSLFCEYAYIINLDTQCLEFWVGFQKEPDEFNRYGTECDDRYYPCKMIGEYSFESLNEESVEHIIASMNRAVEVEFNEDEEVEEERDVTVDDFDDIADAVKNCITSGVLDNGIEWNLEFNM